MSEAPHLITQKIVKEIYHIHLQGYLNTLCKSFITIVSMYARSKILYRILSYTTRQIFKMSCGQWWCINGKRFIIKFDRQFSMLLYFLRLFNTTGNEKWSFYVCTIYPLPSSQSHGYFLHNLSMSSRVLFSLSSLH